jgi:hypothetical protein
LSERQNFISNKVSNLGARLEKEAKLLFITEGGTFLFYTWCKTLRIKVTDTVRMEE